MTSIANSASEAKVQHRSLSIERDYEEFTGWLERILGRFVASELKDLTPDGAMQGFMIINIFDHGADLSMVGQRRKAEQYLIGNPLVAIQLTRHDIRSNPQAAVTITENALRMGLMRRSRIRICLFEDSISESSDSSFQRDQKRAIVLLRSPGCRSAPE